MNDQKIMDAFVEQEQTIIKLKQRILDLEELLSEDLVAENAKLKVRIDELEAEVLDLHYSFR